MIKVKATKKLTDISFEHEGAAVALVGPSVGGAANNRQTIILKSTNGFSRETILKAQQIQVTLDIPEFLQKFFGLYYTESQVLAQLMGYVPPADKVDPWDDTNYIQDQVASFTILKSLQKGDVVEQLQKLSETEYIQFLEDQATLEGVIKQAEKQTTQVKPITKKTKPSQKETKGEPMTVEVVSTDSQNASPELAEVLKALDSQKVELKKALDQITAFKEAEVQAVIKSKTAKVEAVVKNKDHQAIITKACLELDSEDDFGAFLSAIQAMQVSVASSEMFVEKGLQSSVDDKPKESALTKSVKALVAAK